MKDLRASPGSGGGGKKPDNSAHISLAEWYDVEIAPWVGDVSMLSVWQQKIFPTCYFYRLIGSGCRIIEINLVWNYSITLPGRLNTIRTISSSYCLDRGEHEERASGFYDFLGNRILWEMEDKLQVGPHFWLPPLWQASLLNYCNFPHSSCFSHKIYLNTALEAVISDHVELE